MAEALQLFPNPTKPADNADAPTPLMAQYLAIKADYAEYLLFFRLGDFYELFFDDAVLASAALDIALTKRGKHLGADIPMCGVPWHQSEVYLSRLIRRGYRVAICEQTESAQPAKSGKALIERQVVRVITPGTVTEDNLLDARRNNFIAAIAEQDGGYAAAWADISTGRFFIRDLTKSELANVIAHINPAEIILPDKIRADVNAEAALSPLSGIARWQSNSRFSAANAKDKLAAIYEVRTLDGLGEFTPASISAAGALIDYIALTQKSALRLSRPIWQNPHEYLQIDAATARNLELRKKMNGEYAGSLLSAIDRTVTSAGARLMEQTLALPLCDIAAINGRLDAVEFFLADVELRQNLRRILTEVPDFERAMTRIALDRGNPRDLASIRDGLDAAARLSDLFRMGTINGLIRQSVDDLNLHAPLVRNLERALADQLPHFLRDGDFIAAGYSAELDELRMLRDESRRLIANLESGYARDTKIPNLKIRHNNILGYFIEISPKFADRMGTMFAHRQSLATAVRYTTPELAEMEQKLSKAAATALAMEIEIFNRLVLDVKSASAAIAKTAAAIAQLDLSSALAQLAADENYVRPELHDGLDIVIAGGRHPVVEQHLRKSQQKFIANDCRLLPSDGRMIIMTGPNMAGKSTYLRQAALIAIMSQIGCFVPATQCRIGIADRIFSRVGAADDLARGQSTFMVEMTESAAILHQATARSLVILDEIGRGTATFDGLSIAWAMLEHLHDHVQCRGLFATHYHELTALVTTHPGLVAMTMKVKEWNGDIVFLHEVITGAAERSYGIHVAKIAGIPHAVIARARQILAELESTDHNTSELHHLPKQAAMEIPKDIDLIMNQLKQINPDEISPKSAWDMLHQLSELARKTS